MSEAEELDLAAADADDVVAAPLVEVRSIVCSEHPTQVARVFWAVDDIATGAADPCGTPAPPA